MQRAASGKGMPSLLWTFGKMLLMCMLLVPLLWLSISQSSNSKLIRSMSSRLMHAEGLISEETDKRKSLMVEMGMIATELDSLRRVCVPR